MKKVEFGFQQPLGQFLSSVENSMNWSVYIIRCRDNSLYTGISNDVARRFSEHADQAKRCARYLRGRGPLKLVFQADVGSRTKALKMERRIKKMPKADKEKLVAGEWAGRVGFL